MTQTGDNHRPLTSGIEVSIPISEVGPGGLAIEKVNSGTLTGLATRNCDKKKLVLVTNQHVMAGTYPDPVGARGHTWYYRDLKGTEEMYQGQLIPGDKVGGAAEDVALDPTVDNVADVAMCELQDGVLADFKLHDTPHSDRHIARGVKEPTRNMVLTMLGAKTRWLPDP